MSPVPFPGNPSLQQDIDSSVAIELCAKHSEGQWETVSDSEILEADGWLLATSPDAEDIEQLNVDKSYDGTILQKSIGNNLPSSETCVSPKQQGRDIIGGNKWKSAQDISVHPETHSHEGSLVDGAFKSARVAQLDCNNFQDLRQQIQDAQLDLEKRACALRDLKNHIGAVERLFDHRKEHMDAFESTDVEADDDECSLASGSSAETPPPLEAYFQAAGISNILRERLGELEVGSQNFTHRRQELLHALDVSIHEMQERRRDCYARGLDPERFRFRRVSGAENASRPKADVFGKQDFESVVKWLDQDVFVTA